MTTFHLRYYNTNALIGFIVSLGLGIGWLTNLLIEHGHIIGFSTVGLIGTVLLLIDRYLWKYKIFNQL
jgi:hypothetical protein